jgi:hypothetical protein
MVNENESRLAETDISHNKACMCILFIKTYREKEGASEEEINLKQGLLFYLDLYRTPVRFPFMWKSVSTTCDIVNAFLA